MNISWFRTDELTIIAEVGLNHNGNISDAIRLAEVAKDCGCNSVKYQLRSEKSYLNIQGHRDIGSEIVDSYISKTYIDYEGYIRIWNACSEIGIDAFFSVWDLESLRFAESLGSAAYKVGSADMNNSILIDQIAATGKPILLSTGMSSESEIDDLISSLELKSCKYGLLHCHSAYPSPSHHLNLSYIKRLASKTSSPIGYSSHDTSIVASIASIGLGATILEKHITLDRDAYGNDHSVSLEPDELRKYVTECREAFQMLGKGGERVIGPGEKFNRISLSKSVMTSKPVRKGDCLQAEMLDFYPSGEGLSPAEVSKLLDKPLLTDLNPGDLITNVTYFNQPEPIDFTELTNSRLLGFPVRYRDIVNLAATICSSYLEIHLSYQDLFVVPPDEINQLARDRKIGFHAPDIYADNLIFDPFSENNILASRSIDSFDRVLKHVADFHNQYRLDYRLNLVTSFSSYSESSHDSGRSKLYSKINSFIDQCHDAYPQVNILPQSLPALAWYLGGQRYVNTFARPSEILNFCRHHEKRICLDISHLLMACNFYGESFDKYAEDLLEYSDHLHLAGASGVDDEGLSLVLTESIHPFLKDFLLRFNKWQSAIVETWQGHLNDGLGFKQDLEFLASLLKSS